jgi:hypothetical protein
MISNNALMDEQQIGYGGGGDFENPLSRVVHPFSGIINMKGFQLDHPREEI